MKRKIFLLYITMCLLPVLLQGQPSRITSFSMGENVEKTIVKELSYPATISYVETATEHLFVYNDGYLNLRKIPIQLGYSVTDFAIIDNYVYFCANRSGGAVFGIFGWYDFFFGTPSYQVTGIQMQTPSSYVNTLEKMVAYYIADTLELVALGTTAAGYDCVAEMQYATSSWSYRVGELGANSYDNLLDLTQTDDYVIAAGFRDYVSNLICVRAFDKHDIFATSGIQDSSAAFYHHYCQFDSNQIVLSHVGSNIFLTATYWKCYLQTDTDTNVEGAAIGYFDVFSSSNPYVRHYWTTLFYQPYSIGGWKLRGMINPATISDTYFLLQDAEVESVSGLVSMVFDLNYSVISGNPVPVSYSRDERYYSICRYGSTSSQYIMSGIKNADSTSFQFNESLAGQYPCLSDTTFSDTVVYAIRRNFMDAFSVTAFSNITLRNWTRGEKGTYTGTIECPTKGVITKEEDEL